MKGSAYPIAALGGAPSLIGVQAGATRRFPAGQLVNAILQPAGGKSGILGGPVATQLSVNTSTSSTYRTPATTGFSNLELTFANYYLVAGAGDTTLPPNDITIKASLEFVFGGVQKSFPLYFQGQRSFTLKPGADITCAPLGVMIPANTQYFVRAYVTCAASGQWPLSRLAATSQVPEHSNGANGADQTDATGNLSPATAGGLYGPTAIVGHPSTLGSPSILILGDSLAAGFNDTLASSGANGEQGWIEKALAANLPWITHHRGGVTMNDLTTYGHSRSFSRLMQFCTSAICELGSNDLYALATPLATMQSRAQSVWGEMLGRGLAVYQTTITPRTTSTDSWATVANQTIVSAPAGVEAMRRRSANDALKLDPQVGLIEVLAGKATLDQAIIALPEVGFDILPLAKGAHLSKSPFESPELIDLLSQVKQRYDLIVLDTAPVLPVIDTRVLAEHVDSVCVLARWRSTPAQASATALRLLRNLGVEVQGVALTQVDLRQQARGGGSSDAAYYYKAYEGYYLD